MKNAPTPRQLAVAAVVAAIIAGGFLWITGDRAGRGGEVVAGEKFDAIDCQARQFDASPSVALMFAAPVALDQKLGERISVLDLGPAPPRK